MFLLVAIINAHVKTVQLYNLITNLQENVTIRKQKAR